jgi:hypothetical protein
LIASTSFSPSAAELMMLVSSRRSGSTAIVMPRGRFRRRAAAELHELLERLILREPVGDAARAAAAEHPDLRPEPRQARDRLADVRHLLLAIDVGTGDLQRRRQEEIRRGHRQPERLDVGGGFLEVGVGQRGEFRRAELEIVEACRLAASMFLSGAQSDLNARAGRG